MNEQKLLFRTWHPNSKRMGAIFSLDDLTVPNGIMYIGEIINKKFVQGIIIRSIGRVDSTGKEIFEGDFFISYTPDGQRSYTIIEYKTLMQYHTGYEIGENSVLLKIAGNIYENPDLLKQ